MVTVDGMLARKGSMSALADSGGTEVGPGCPTYTPMARARVAALTDLPARWKADAQEGQGDLSRPPPSASQPTGFAQLPATGFRGC
jgi:hypothetical protein